MTDHTWGYNYALAAAELLREELLPYCDRIEIGGSVRRKLRIVGDVELVCVPKEGETVMATDQLDEHLQELIANGRLDYRPNTLGRRQYGPQNKLLVDCWNRGLPIDIFTADERNWGMFLLVRTGSKVFNMKVMGELKRRGYAGHAYPKYLGEGKWQGGITAPDGTEILCPTEKTVFDVLGWEYKEPEERI